MSTTRSSSVQSLLGGDETPSRRRSRESGDTNASKPGLLAKLTDARKTFFGRNQTPDTLFNSHEQNKLLLSYILSQPQPQLDAIQELEKNGAQLNAITEDGCSALHLLARADLQSMECINIVQYLITKGCDPSKQNDYGWTAGNSLCVGYWKYRFGDVSSKNDDRCHNYPSQTQLLHIAARKNESVLIRILIKTYKARVNVYDENGRSPLHISCYEDKLDALQALLENDADFIKGIRLNPNENPVSICVKRQHDSCLKAIFK
ncbi:unnamed protein product, partial [Didymodactylos carnosus]